MFVGHDLTVLSLVFAAFPCLIPKWSLSLWRMGGVPVHSCKLTLTPIRICKLTLTQPAPALLLYTYCLLVKCLVSCTEVHLGRFRPAFSVLKPSLCQRESEISELLYVYFRWYTDTADIASDPIIRKLFPFQLPFNTS